MIIRDVSLSEINKNDQKVSQQKEENTSISVKCRGPTTGHLTSQGVKD